jgi:hypothetical protein
LQRQNARPSGLAIARCTAGFNAGGPDLRFDQKQDSAAAFLVEAILRKTMPKQVNTELKLGDYD